MGWKVDLIKHQTSRTKSRFSPRLPIDSMVLVWFHMSSFLRKAADDFLGLDSRSAVLEPGIAWLSARASLHMSEPAWLWVNP